MQAAPGNYRRIYPEGVSAGKNAGTTGTYRTSHAACQQVWSHHTVCGKLTFNYRPVTPTRNKWYRPQLSSLGVRSWSCTKCLCIKTTVTFFSLQFINNAKHSFILASMHGHRNRQFKLEYFIHIILQAIVITCTLAS